MRRLLLAVCTALVLAASASADDVVVPLTVRPGSLTLVPATVFARGGRVSVTVTDARGRGAGWTLVARLAGPSRKAVVTGVDMRCGVHATCTLPQSHIRYPVTLSSLRAAAVLGAQRGTGMGAIALSVRLGSKGDDSAAIRFAVRPS